MRRNILIGIGILVAILPYSGFPSWFDTTLYTLSGLAIIFLLTLSQKRGVHRSFSEEKSASPDEAGEPRTLHVKRREVEDYPHLHVEKETTLDTEHIEESPEEDTVIEKKVTVVHTRRQKNSDRAISGEAP